MIYLEESPSNISTLIENQFPNFVQENNSKFISFLTGYYQSQELKYQPLDIVANIIDYYNISYFKPNKLVETTKTTSALTDSDTTVTVSSTVGFPKSGFIQIRDEIIFYESKTDTTFVDCTRGTSALVLKSIPKSNLVLTSSTAASHKTNKTVTNIAFAYANEFFSRIKSELAVLLPEVLDESIDVAAFISKIKTFYAAKGSLNGHKILFKILFNDKKFNIKLKPRGTGAELGISNYGGSIGSTTILNGGSNYDSRKDSSNQLINPPIVDIFGSGVGKQVGAIRPDKTAVIEVTGITNGVIDSINVTNQGELYRGTISSRVRPRNFISNELVYNQSKTGSGRVEYFDPKTGELILNDVIGYFSPNEEVLTDDGEKARGFIAKSFTTPVSSRTGLVVKGEEQNIEFPKEYTFKTSNSRFTSKQIIRCKLLDGYGLPNNRLPEIFTLKQDSDKLFGVSGIDISVDGITIISNNVYEFDVSTNNTIDALYLPPSTVITKELTGITNSSSNVVITVDDASGFPLTNGIIFVNGVEISYKSRSMHQLFDCKYSGSTTLNLSVADEVISFGRTKFDQEWQSNQSIEKNTYRFYNNNLYISENSGTTGTVAPVHTSGKQYDGDETVLWRYYDTNRYDYSLTIEIDNFSPNPRFQVLALPGELFIEESGALYTQSKNTFNFVDSDSPNIKVYNFTTNEISDRLSLVLATNFNRTRSTVTDSRFPSYKSLSGFLTQHDYEDYIYVPTSTIPTWWNDIVNTSGSSPFSIADAKKVAFTDQKLLSRWKKSGLIFETQSVSEFTKTKKAIGLNIDAIQLNSYKGNVVDYGYIDKFFISDGGNHPVSYTEDAVTKIATSVNHNDNPAFRITPSSSDTGVTQSDETNNRNFTKISAGISKINFTKIYNYFETLTINANSIVVGEIYKIVSVGTTDFTLLGASENTVGTIFTATKDGTGSGSGTVSSNPLENRTEKPNIEVVNNNPQLVLSFASADDSAYNNLNDSTDVITFNNHNLKTCDEITFTSDDNYFVSLISNTKYFVQKIDNNTFTIHKTKSDALLNINKVSLKRNPVSAFDSSPIIDIDIKFKFERKQQNPLNFEEAELELSYKNGKIDNIVIKKSGKGYIELPEIKIFGGGLANPISIPFSVDKDIFVELSGPLTSYHNFDNENFNVIENFTTIAKNYSIAPTVTINSGVDAEATSLISQGKLTSISLLSFGTLYNIPPKVEVIGNGENTVDAVVESIINDSGSVVGFNIINEGSGYQSAPRIKITSAGSGGSITAKLREWTFNLVRELNKYDRIDDFGGYVYDSGDSTPTSNNPNKFKVIDYKLDFPASDDQKQYHLIQNADKLLARHIRDKKGITGTDAQVIAAYTHSPAIAISYDGIPIYGSNKVNQDRTKPSTVAGGTNPLEEIKSRYKFKHDTTSSGVSGEQSIELPIGSGIFYYINRIGGPSLSDYPMGTFIEDYEFVEGDNNDLDIHNGRFSITPEFPAGRYVYYATRESYDPVTNALIARQSVSFNGFPYFIGDTFAGEYDTYMNTRCRTNDKIPSRFTRIFEKKVDPSPLLGFPGLNANDEYPSEDNKIVKTVFSTDKVTPGSVDSVIIENKGSNYRVGDRLSVNNDRTFGSGFSAFISKVGGKKIIAVINSINDDYRKVTFRTTENHNLIVGDYVNFDYTSMTNSDSPIEVNLHEIQFNDPLKSVSNKLVELTNIDLFLRKNQDIETFKDKKVFSLNLNFRYIYQLNLRANSEFKLTYDIESVNEYFTLEKSPTDTIILNAQKIPNRLYLHLTAGTSGQQYIYELNIVKDYFGLHKVFSVDNFRKEFTVEFPESTEFYEKEKIFYNIKSFGASGPIEEISIANKGFNYRKLPVITGVIKKGTVDTPAGDGQAIIQADSNSIGKLKNIKYNSIGTSLTSNKNVNYYINTPATAKVINNFEIYDVEIVNGGKNYDNTITLVASEDGVQKTTTLEAKVNVGTISNITIVNGGSNFSKEPTISIVSKFGSGAVLKAKIRRKNITPGTIIKGKSSGFAETDLFPVQVETKVVDFDPDTSTIQFDEFIGQFDNNDMMFTPDGEQYGKIVSIKRSKVYSKVSPTATINFERADISGNTSEYLQKITDSDYYQDWSYSLTSSRDTKEWKVEQNINTHPAGFKQFGKKIIETRKSFFNNPADAFKGNVIFTATLNDNIDLKLQKAPCKTQKVLFPVKSGFIVGKYYYGAKTGAMGLVTDVGETFVEFLILNSIKFELGELVIRVNVNFDGSKTQHTTKMLSFVNGILQELNGSYITALTDDTSPVLQYIPKFDIDNEIIVLNKSSTDYDVMDTNTLPVGETFFTLKKNNVIYPITAATKEQFIISIAGSVQKTDDIGTIGNNTVTLSNPLAHESEIFAFRHSKLKKLTFTGSGDTYQLKSGGVNYTPSSACQLLIFVNGASQSHLTALDDYDIQNGNEIKLQESINQSDIFGWCLDETATCNTVNVSALNNNKSLNVSPCNSQNVTQFIESNTSKKPRSIFELRRKQIDGTLHPSDNGTHIDGFDTRFTYTSPGQSSSYVEVLDPIAFNSSNTAFTLKSGGVNYVPSNGKESLVVYLENSIVDPNDYNISGSTITFTTAYPTNQECTIIDFVSSFRSNTNNERGSVIDRLNVGQDGSRRTFNLSDRGVPKYVKNIADVFNIKNGALKIPSNGFTDHRDIVLSSHTISDNKITFVDAPVASENNLLLYFNRQLLPEPSKNVILDKFVCYDGTSTQYPITNAGIRFTPANVNNLFVLRSGVIQKPGTDYTISGSTITFVVPPVVQDNILLFYSYNGLDQNIMLDSLTGINGSQTTHALYNSGVSFTPPSVDDLMVSRNGIIQNPTQDFTVSGSNITFTTALQTTDSVFIIYTHGSEELTISSDASVSSTVHRYTLSSALASNDEDNIILFADGVPRFHTKGDFTIQNSNTELHLNHADGITPTQVFVVKYPSVLIVDDPAECPNGTRTNFRLLYNNLNLNSTNVASNADILVSVNGVVQHPGQQYTLTANRGQIQFTTAPQHDDEVFMIRMLGNALINLTNVSGNQYTVSSSQTTEKENVIVFSNNTWKFEELGDFTWNNNSTITLNSAHTTGNLFAIKFYGVVNLLDQLNSPFNGTNTRFNLMDGEKFLSPTGATYNASSGNLVLTIPNHGLSNGSVVKIASDSLSFTCSMDGNYRVKTYPRTTDPVYGNTITVGSATTNTITLPIGSSPLVRYTPGANTTYNTVTGDLVLDIGTTGASALYVGEQIKLSNGALTFTCASDNNVAQLSHPRAFVDPHTPESATYNASTGIVTITLTNHGFVNDDWVKLEDGALTFTCTKDSNGSNHAYPRSTDPISGKFIQIFNTTTNTFDIDVGVSPAGEQYAHTFVSAVTSSLKRKRDRHDTPLVITSIDTTAGTITVNVGPSPEKSAHTFVSALSNSVITGGNYAHTFVSAKPRSVIVEFDQENYVPVGTTSNDNVPHESSILVVKNGKILDPGVDYTLSGDIKSQIQFTTAPISTDVISVRCVGSFDKLDTLNNQSGTSFGLKKGGVDYYPDADIARPRDFENQILVIKDGEIQSPLYDYYIFNSNIKFVSSVSFTKLVILDFRGTYEDIRVFSRNNQISVGDELILDGEDARVVTAILSPTVLTTSSYSGTTPVQAVATTTISNGNISSMNITNDGSGYLNTVKLKTVGTGRGGRSAGKISFTGGGNIVSAEVTDPGHNIFNNHIVFPTVNANVYKKQPLDSTEVRRATKLSSDINANVETISLANTTGLASNPPSITVSQTGNNNSTPSGSGAQFKVYISGGELRKIDILSAGSGYDDRETTIALSGGGGTGCVLEPVIDGSGAFTAVNIKNPGVGYDTFRIIINNEMIEYTTVTSNQIDGCTRGVAGTTAVSHSAQIESPDNPSTYTPVYFDNYL